MILGMEQTEGKQRGRGDRNKQTKLILITLFVPVYLAILEAGSFWAIV